MENTDNSKNILDVIYGDIVEPVLKVIPLRLIKKILIGLFILWLFFTIMQIIVNILISKNPEMTFEDRCDKWFYNIFDQKCREKRTNEMLNKRLSPVNDELSKNSNLLTKLTTEIQTIKGNVNNLYESTRENLIETRNQIKTKIKNIRKVFGSIQSMFMHLFDSIKYTIYSAIFATNAIKGVFRLTEPIMKKFRRSKEKKEKRARKKRRRKEKRERKKKK